MTEPFSAESRLIQDGYYGGRVLADRLRPLSTRPVPVDLPATSFGGVESTWERRAGGLPRPRRPA